MTERAIDSRYPPLPKTPLLVPLYPEQPSFCEASVADAEGALRADLAASFGVDSEAVILGGSASSLVRDYIVHNSKERIAVPHYSCQSLIDAIINAKATPVFYDIEGDTTVGERAVQFALTERCDTFIWPTYFGNSLRDARLQEKLHDSDVVIIYDEAQANPFSDAAQQTRADLKYEDVVLYSFGRSKLLAATGGGALYAAATDSLPSESTRTHENPLTKLSQLRFETQLELLEARLHQGTGDSRIGEHNALMALRQMKRYNAVRSIHAEQYSSLRTAIIENLGKTALYFLQHIDVAPTVLAVKVPEDQRYKTLTTLSREGIQSTWYYHPIHRVNRFRHYPAQDDDGAAAVANSVVVLPFQWTHTSEQVGTLIDVIQKLRVV